MEAANRESLRIAMNMSNTQVAVEKESSNAADLARGAYGSSDRLFGSP